MFLKKITQSVQKEVQKEAQKEIDYIVGLVFRDKKYSSLIDCLYFKCYYADYFHKILGIIMHIKNYISSTKLAKKTSETLNSFSAGETDKVIILKNNEPKAILMSIESYESMEEEIEDLRLAALALSRIQNFDPAEVISHKEMMKKYAD